MSTRGRSEFPFLEHLGDNIATFTRIEVLKKETRSSLVKLVRRKSKTEEEFQWRTSKIKDSDLIDMEIDYHGVHREVREIVENPRYRPWLQAGQLAKKYVTDTKKEKLEKYVVPHIKKPLMKIQDKTENQIVKAGVQIAYSLIMRKLGL